MGIVIEMPLPEYAVCYNKENILDVAEFFLHKKAMNHRRLQAFCFLAQVFCYRNFGELMCDEEFEAWANGPTSRAIYNRYSEWQALDIITIRSYHISSEKHLLLLNWIWDKFKKTTTEQIISDIQNIDEWNLIRGNINKRNPCFSVIPKEFYNITYKNFRRY